MILSAIVDSVESKVMRLPKSTDPPGRFWRTTNGVSVMACFYNLTSAQCSVEMYTAGIRLLLFYCGLLTESNKHIVRLY